MYIGLMHEEKILGNTPNNTYCLVLVLFFKVGIRTFSHENENEAIGIFGGFPKICSSCIGHIRYAATWLTCLCCVQSIIVLLPLL